MFKSYKYRIYPNKVQLVLLNKTFGCVRYFWNKQVEIFNSYNKETNPNPLYLTSTQIRHQNDWMLEVSAAAIQQKEIDFKEFKNQKFNKQRKKVIGRPKFKKKSNNQLYRLPNKKFSLKDNKIRLEKIGNVKIVIDRQIPIEAKLMSVTISKNCSNQYFVSVLVDHEIIKFNKTNKEVGIDVGLKEFLVQSDNIIVGNPKYFSNSQAKLKGIQQRHSKKIKESKRRNKFRLKVSRLHQKISNQRDWFLNNESLRIVRDYDVIYIENLNIQGMIKNHKLAKSIYDVSWSKFFDMLKYKSNWYDKQVIKIERFEPTSKICSCCGWIDDNQTLNDRIFNCSRCGLTIDRDLNAAINIRNIGIKALGVDNAIRTLRDKVTICDEAFKSQNSRNIIRFTTMI